MTTYRDSSHSTTHSNGLAVAGLVCGIVGLVFFNFILGPLAIIFGGIGLSRANHGADHRGMSIASIILGIIDIVIFAILLAVTAHNGGHWYMSA